MNTVKGINKPKLQPKTRVYLMIREMTEEQDAQIRRKLALEIFPLLEEMEEGVK